jgi:deazaflavin-dependent oxidoreductase (nitroreductase family)
VPSWVHNIAANPRVRIEVDNRILAATADVADGDERARLWDRHVAELPHFAEYPAKAGRDIPMIRLTPDAGS